MNHPLVVHLSKARYDVRIDRATKWGNPFRSGKDGDRPSVICKYEVWLKQQPLLMAALPELRNKILGCWCAPKACHGDVLARLANRLPPDIYLPKTDEHIPVYYGRASKDSICPVCGEDFGRHQQYLFGERGDNWNLSLFKTCDGKYWHL